MFCIFYILLALVKFAFQLFITIATAVLRFTWWAVKKLAYLVAFAALGIVAGIIKLKEVISNAIYNHKCKKRWQNQQVNLSA